MREFKTLFEDSRAVILTNDWIDQYRSKYRLNTPLRKPKGGIDVEVETLPPVEPNTIQTQALLALKKSRIEGLSRGLVVMATGTERLGLQPWTAKQLKPKKYSL